MQAPLLVRPLSPDERLALEAGTRSGVSFTRRRAQILLASADGEHVPTIARVLRCDEQTVRNALHAFTATGLAALQPGSRRPHTLPHTVMDAAACAQLQALLHHSPRAFDHPTSVWTLDLAARTCATLGITPRQVSDETIRMAIHRLGVRWQRAKQWITSPDPGYARKKAGATG
jgi:transposase